MAVLLSAALCDACIAVPSLVFRVAIICDNIITARCQGVAAWLKAVFIQ
jgi:hypothetical protein